MKKLLAIISYVLFFTFIMSVSVSATQPITPFRDIDGYEWAHESIEKLHESGILKGTGNGYFNPSGYLRTAEMAMTLYRIAGSPKTEKTWENYKIWNIDPNGTLYPSSDVWYYDCAVWAVENGIVELTIADVPIFYAITRAFPKQENNMYFATGEWYEDIGVGEHFPSYRRIRRGDAVISMFFCAEYVKKDTSSRSDITSFSDYDEITDKNWTNLYPVNDIVYVRTDTREIEETHIRDYLSWAVANGILKGYPDGSLRPYEFVTRAEYAVMLERFIDYLNK